VEKHSGTEERPHIHPNWQFYPTLNDSDNETSSIILPFILHSTMKPPLRIAILECDTPLPQTDAKYHGYGGVFTVLLQAGADALGHPGLSSKEGLDITKFNVEHEELYPELDNIDAVLLTGSSMSAVFSYAVVRIVSMKSVKTH